MKIPIYHKIFVIVIIILLIILLITFIPLLQGYNLKSKFYVLKKDTVILSPNTGENFGFLKKGTIIKKSSIYDQDDIKNKVKYKLVIYREFEQFNYFTERDDKNKIEKYELKEIQ